MGKHRHIGNRSGNTDMYGNAAPGTPITPQPSKFTPEQTTEMEATAKAAGEVPDPAPKPKAEVKADAAEADAETNGAPAPTTRGRSGFRGG
jgi:hypothetical protein